MELEKMKQRAMSISEQYQQAKLEIANLEIAVTNEKAKTAIRQVIEKTKSSSPIEFQRILPEFVELCRSFIELEVMENTRIQIREKEQIVVKMTSMAPDTTNSVAQDAPSTSNRGVNYVENLTEQLDNIKKSRRMYDPPSLEETDSFKTLIKKKELLMGIEYTKSGKKSKKNKNKGKEAEKVNTKTDMDMGMKPEDDDLPSGDPQ